MNDQRRPVPQVGPTSVFPWSGERDRARDDYWRVHDAHGNSIARVYYPDSDALCIIAAPELRQMVGRLARGESVSRGDAERLARRAGLAL